MIALLACVAACVPTPGQTHQPHLTAEQLAAAGSPAAEGTEPEEPAPPGPPDPVQLQQLTVDLSDGVSMVLLRIPAGSFVMGDDAGYACERPAHTVTIKS